MLRCNEVTRLHASDEIHRVSWRKRIAVRLHLLMCRSCQRYVQELAAIGAAARRMTETRQEEEERLESIIRRVVPGGSQPDQ